MMTLSRDDFARVCYSFGEVYKPKRNRVFGFINLFSVWLSFNEVD